MNPEFPIPAPTDNWHQGVLAGFDLETTGRNPHQARIVTASIVLISPDGEHRSSADWLVNPGVEIPAEATEVHGITTEQAQANGLAPEIGLRQIVETLADVMDAGIPVVAFNGAYDFTVLTAEIARHQLEPLDIRGVVDPFILDKQMDTYRKGARTLSAVSELYGVQLSDAHSADADAVAAAQVAQRLVAKFPKLAMPLDKIFSAQKKWKAAQSESFEQYLRKKDPQATVSRNWPVEPPRGE